MIKKKHTIKTVETLFVESTDIICDGCGITIAHYNEDGDICKPYTDMYFNVNTGLYECDKDSVEFLEEHQFCPQCIDKVLEDYERLCLDRRNSRYIELYNIITPESIEEEE